MRSVFVTIVLILFPVFLFAGKDLDSLLRALDKTIENSQKYSDAREVRLAKLKQIFISKTTDQQCYNISVQLYNE